MANEKKEIQRVHAVFVAAILTSIFTGAYLYILYDITPPTPEIKILNGNKTYVRDQSNDPQIVNEYTDNTDTVTEPSAVPPENSIYKIADMFENLQFRIKELKTFFESDNTYKRGE